MKSATSEKLKINETGEMFELRKLRLLDSEVKIENRRSWWYEGDFFKLLQLLLIQYSNDVNSYVFLLMYIYK